MPKVKILYLITKSNWGGAQRYVYDLATNLPKGRYEAVVACGEGLPAGRQGKILEEKLRLAQVRVVKIKGLERDVGLGREIQVFFKLLKLFLQERPAVIHLNSSKIGGLGALAGRLMSRARLIFTAHGWAFQEERSWWEQWLIKLASWLTIILCHQVITVSEHDRQAVSRWPAVKNKVIRIYNGIGPIKFQERGQARAVICQRCGPGLPREGQWIGTIAELHRNKGLGFAVQAMEQVTDIIPQVYLVIIGGGEEKERLTKLIQEKHLAGKVFLAGHINNAPALLKAFDIAVLPSIKEGLPYFLLEAGLVGLPVVATSAGGVPEIIKNNTQGLLVKPGNVEEIAKNIKLLLDNPYLTQKLGVGLQAVVRQKFSIEEMLKRTLKVYRS